MGNGTIIRVPRHDNFSIINNMFLRDKDLSLKGKGLMAFMLSLPPDWDYSIQGLMASTNTGEAQIRSCLEELKGLGYLQITRQRDQLGRLGSSSYLLVEKPNVENPVLDNPVLENQVQISTNLNKVLNGINTNIVAEKKKTTYPPRFKRPTLEEVQAYIKEKNYNVDPQKFFDYYEATDWHFKDGKPVKYWKQCVVTWNGRQSNNNSAFQPNQNVPPPPAPRVDGAELARQSAERRKQSDMEAEEIARRLFREGKL